MTDRGKTRFVYGPVPSRRLGFSLGVDILPFKTCTLDCIYCQLGRTPRTSCRRRAYFSMRNILAQIRQALQEGGRIDVITFSGSGEPTLNKNLGPLIRGIKRMTRIPVAVLTNGTLLYRREVRKDLLSADLVVPSLDAATANVFRKVNRPHPLLKASRILDGLLKFRKEYSGQIWLEIMLVKGINDRPGDIRSLKKIVDNVRPDRIHLNTVVRPPADSRARPLSMKELERIRASFGDSAEIIASPGKRIRKKVRADLAQAILGMVRRRPVTLEDISLSLGAHRDEILKTLDSLLDGRKIRSRRHGRKIFYKAA